MKQREPVLSAQLFDKYFLKEVEEKFLKEKRGHVRKVSYVPVRYTNYDRIFSGLIINFSQDGCFIETDEPLFVGEEILVDIKTNSSSKTVRLKGIVAHVNRLGIGIKYKEIMALTTKLGSKFSNDPGLMT